MPAPGNEQANGSGFSCRARVCRNKGLAGQWTRVQATLQDIDHDAEVAEDTSSKQLGSDLVDSSLSQSLSQQHSQSIPQYTTSLSFTELEDEDELHVTSPGDHGVIKSSYSRPVGRFCSRGCTDLGHCPNYWGPPPHTPCLSPTIAAVASLR